MASSPDYEYDIRYIRDDSAVQYDYPAREGIRNELICDQLYTDQPTNSSLMLGKLQVEIQNSNTASLCYCGSTLPPHVWSEGILGWARTTLNKMEDAQPASLSDFFETRGSPEWSVQIVNRTDPDPVQRMIEDLFGGLSIDVSNTELPEEDDDLLMLLRDGDVVKTSSVDTLKHTLLMVNSDLYRTGGTSLEETDPPDVITQLSETLFRLRGYPESHTEKLVLTLISRYIEYQAWVQEAGTLRTSFQRLSLLDEERGTRDVYDRLGDCSTLDVHVYGIPDWDPPETLGVTIHGVSDEEIARNWFVIYEGDDRPGVAMLAVEVGPNEWRGFWTVDQNEIGRINQYVRQAY